MYTSLSKSSDCITVREAHTTYRIRWDLISVTYVGCIQCKMKIMKCKTVLKNYLLTTFSGKVLILTTFNIKVVKSDYDFMKRV